jgi:hypothetical protein
MTHEVRAVDYRRKHDSQTRCAPILQSADIDANHVRYGEQFFVMRGQNGVDVPLRGGRTILRHILSATESESNHEKEQVEGTPPPAYSAGLHYSKIAKA